METGLEQKAPPPPQQPAIPAGKSRPTEMVNELWLRPREWAALGLFFTLVLCFFPRLWAKVERFETGPDYRIPYELSKDYWLYERRARGTPSDSIFVLGDSVVWGEFVRRDGTLSHFLGAEAGAPGRFVNGGVNGLFPLAMEGLVRDYAGTLRGRKVMLHCNLLWMSSAKADLRTQKEETFNHPRLVPQFRPKIPSYRADLSTRIGIVFERHVPFLSWVGHLQNAYFDQRNLLAWTMADDGGDPPRYTNCYKNPLKQITFEAPGELANDPLRGLSSPRHKPWFESGMTQQSFEWVELDRSLQWAAFQRLVQLLRSRHNELIVVIGPFNEHILTANNREKFHRLRDQAEAWLKNENIPVLAPALLPTALYADGSHPLTAGYAQLAKEIAATPQFRQWLTQGR